MILSINDERLKEQYRQAVEEYNPPAYRTNYFMIKKEYDKAMSYIYRMWLYNDNQFGFVFNQGKLNTSLVGEIVTTRINP